MCCQSCGLVLYSISRAAARPPWSGSGNSFGGKSEGRIPISKVVDANGRSSATVPYCLTHLGATQRAAQGLASAADAGGASFGRSPGRRVSAIKSSCFLSSSATPELVAAVFARTIFPNQSEKQRLRIVKKLLPIFEQAMRERESRDVLRSTRELRLM